MRIRDAEKADLPAILAIYNQVIATSAAVYTNVPATLAERRSWPQARRGQGYPVPVAERGGDVVTDMTKSIDGQLIAS